MLPPFNFMKSCIICIESSLISSSLPTKRDDGGKRERETGEDEGNS